MGQLPNSYAGVYTTLLYDKMCGPNVKMWCECYNECRLVYNNVMKQTKYTVWVYTTVFYRAVFIGWMLFSAFDKLECVVWVYSSALVKWLYMAWMHTTTFRNVLYVF